MRDKSLSDEHFVALMNTILSDPHPHGRAELMRELTRSLIRLLYFHTPILEQLISKLDVDMKEAFEAPPFNHPILNELANALVARVKPDAIRNLGLLRAFLDVRAEFVTAVRKHVPEDMIHKDWELD